ncbi:DUF927 domain-containing protein [Leisingera daeponensis]|uniref:DUF927 domain-containing protein n=1 Tax=Leisingera daeponensis TaxID=405746 RepID=UPI001C9644C2|nr:DUF927 domain-containing protein [Leisingera daeponensis]MBY6054952.1 DUF927 domain-containing protein [Leisingera daeponensis]
MAPGRVSGPAQTKAGKEAEQCNQKIDCPRRRPDMPANLHLAVDNEPDYLNDAEIIGTETAAFRELLDREVTFLIGEMWGQRDRRNTQDGDWKPQTMTWGNWIGGQEGTKNAPAWGFSRHPEGKHKEGSCIVLGSSVGGARKAKAMDTMFAVGLDIDSGITYDEMVNKLEELGRFALIYTTFSHGKTGLELKRDDVLRKLDLSRDPSAEEVRDYLRRFDKNRYEETYIEAATIREQKKQTAEGVKIVLDTPELEKMRVIFPLAEPVKLIDLADTQDAALRFWEDKVTGLARNVLGVHFDVSATDPSRLFFLPRHAKGSYFDCAIVQGDPLSYEDISAMEKAAYTRERVPGGSNVRHYTESGVDLNSWYVDHADRFQIADMLEALCPDKVRGEAASVAGKVIECPFEAGHSSEGGSGTIAINALDAHGERGTIKCSHDSCQGRKNAEYLAEMLAQDWFTEEELFAPDAGFILEAGEELTAGDDSSLADEFEPVTDWLPKRFKLKGKTIYATSDEEDSPVCQAFDVVGRSSNADGTDDAGRIISFVNENGKRVEVTISRADIAGDGNAVLRELAGKGLLIFGRGKKATDRLLDLLNEITPKRRVPTVYVPGWVRDEHGEIAGFMHPNGVYDRVSGPQFRLLEGSRIEVVKAKGSLAGWTEGGEEALKYADTNFYWPLGLISGFAGPLLGILEWHPCGFSLSGLTSKGKTMAQLMGSTVWGSPDPGRGVLFTANTTGNAMEDLAVRGTDSFLAMDEIGAMSDKRALASILFALSTGRTKSRKSGPGRGLTEGDNFRPFAVLSSEHGMKNEISGAGDKYRGGLAVRFPDIDVSEGEDISPDKLAKLDAFKANYGHAGPAFVRFLIESGVASDRAKLEKEVLEIAATLAEGNGAAMGRAARVFAVAQRAGELAADAALLGDPDTAKKALRKAVKRAWEVFTASDEAGAANGGEALLDTLRSFLFGELNRRIIEMGNLPEVSDGHVHARGEVLGWADSDVIYLDSSKIKDPSVLGVDIGKREELLRQLKELGVLIVPSGKGNTFRQLPKELAEGAGEEGAAVRNIRLCRKVLGI